MTTHPPRRHRIQNRYPTNDVNNNDAYNIPFNDNTNNIPNNIPNNNRNHDNNQINQINQIDNLYGDVINNGQLNIDTANELIERFNTLHNRRLRNFMNTQGQTINTLRETNTQQAQRIQRMIRYQNIEHENMDVRVPTDENTVIDPSGNIFTQAPTPVVPDISPPPQIPRTDTLPPAPQRPTDTLPPAPQRPTEGPNRCCICLNSPSNYINTACGHCCCCQNCVTRIITTAHANYEMPHCPICNEVGGRFIRVYYS